MDSFSNNFGAYVFVPAGAGTGQSATAGGTGDATELSSPWIDRQGYYSAKIIAVGLSTLADTETLTLSGNLQDASSSAGAGVADFGTAVAGVVAATGETTAAGFAADCGDFDLSGADRYIRWQGTQTHSAGSTDTSITGWLILLGGSDALPAS